MAMLAIETERMSEVRQSAIVRHIDIFRPVEDDMDAFMETFDSAITVGDEGWDRWARRNKVDERKVGSEDYLMITYLGLSPYLKHPDNKVDLVDATYFMQVRLHNTEDEYIDFLFFLLKS